MGCLQVRLHRLVALQALNTAIALFNMAASPTKAPEAATRPWLPIAVQLALSGILPIYGVLHIERRMRRIFACEAADPWPDGPSKARASLQLHLDKPAYVAVVYGLGSLLGVL